MERGKILFSKILLAFCILSLILNLFQCKNNKEEFDREIELKDYIKNVHKVTLSNERQFIFLLSNKFCNCTGDPKEIIPNIFANDSTNKIILLEKLDSNLLNSLSKLTNTNIYVDTLSQLASYGLSNSIDFIFEIKNKKIVYWNYLDTKTDSTIGVRYKK